MGNLIFYILIIFLPLGQLGRVSRLGDISILFNDFLVGAVVIGYLLYKLIRKESIFIDKIYKLVLLFIAIGLISLAFNWPNYALKEITTASLYLLRFFIYSFLYTIFLNEKINLKKVSQLFIYSIGTMAVIGLIQYTFFPNLVSLSAYGWDPHLYRLTAPFLDPTFTGALLSLGMIFTAVSYFNGRITKKNIVLVAMIYLALALTYSRAVYLMYLIGMLTIGIVKKSPKFILIVLFIGTLTIFLLPKQKSYGTNLQREETISARIKNWQNSIYLWQKSPILGNGFNTYRYTQKKYNILNEDSIKINNAGGGGDSSILFVLATTGVFGLGIYLTLGFNLLKQAYEKKTDIISLALFSFLIGLFFHSFTANSLFYPFIMEVMWILSGISMSRLLRHSVPRNDNPLKDSEI